MERFVVPNALAEEMCDRLGVALPADLDGVGELYRVWAERIPFDSIAKAIALREGSVPPGADPVEFCDRWLTSGVGATCWGHVAAMAALLEVAGFECRVGLDRFLGGDVVDFHAFVVVDDGGAGLALDVTHFSGVPLPVEPGAVGTHPAYPVAFVEDGGRLMHEYVRMSRDSDVVGRYALLSTLLDAADVRSFCEVARVYGMRARSLYHRRFTATAMVDARPADDGSALVRRTFAADGVREERFTDPDEAFAAIGYGVGAVDLAVRAGLIECPAGGPVRFVPRPVD